MVTRHGLTVPAFGGAGRCQRETDEQARRWGRTWLARRGIRTGAPSPLCESRTSPRFFAAEPQRSQRSEEILGLLWVAIAVPRSSSWASTRPSQKIQVFTASAVRVHGERRPPAHRARTRCPWPQPARVHGERRPCSRRAPSCSRRASARCAQPIPRISPPFKANPRSPLL